MILFALISLSCISASDNNDPAEIIAQDNSMNADEIVAQDNDMNADDIAAQTDKNTEKIYTNGENEISDFSTLNTEIANSTVDTIQLTKNYIYNPEKDSDYINGIIIDKADFTIDGQGHSIDGAGLARIFDIRENNLTLKNINFINGFSKNGGAIISENGDLTIIDCNFTNNKATSDEGNGGAIFYEGDSLTIKNSKFIDNIANNETGDSGAIFFDGYKLNIFQCEFINNSANYDGVMYANGDNITISKSLFENNKAKSGIIVIEAVNSLIDECDFIKNTAEIYVGVSNIEGTMRINNSYFTNNTAERTTRVIRNSQHQTVIISNCVFENNIGNEGNYTIDNNYGTIYLYNNTINTQSSEIYNYGGNISSPSTAIALENKTIYTAVGEKRTLTAIIIDDNGNLIEEAYYVYFKINDETIESTYNPKTSKYEAEYTFNTIGSIPISIECPSINITVQQGTCDVRQHTYVDLVNEIDNCQNNTLELTKDYIYDPVNDSSYTNGIVIDKADFTIDGQGHTINGAGLARIFNITANNVTLKNINFINGFSKNGGAIISENGDLTIIDCNFTKNKVTSDDGSGGAIFYEGDSLTIKNSKFIDNIANNESSNSGAIYFDGNNLNILESEFINNFATSEGVMLANGNNITISKSRFENNKAKNSMIVLYATNSLIDECDFINNSAEKYVGVFNTGATMTINNSYFANNTAEKSTRVIRNSQYQTLIISNCVFENNIGNEGNYTIDNNYGTIYLYNNTINTQSSEIYNYGGNISSPSTAIALENKTIYTAVGEKRTLTAIIIDDNGNLIEEAYYVYFKINDETIESTYNPKTSKYEAEYTFNTIGSIPISIECPSINITVQQGTCDVGESFANLANEINNCQNNTLKLTKDYSYVDSIYTNGIVIGKDNFTIDGQGHTINGAGLARIFNITANNITLKNINFINGFSKNGGAINCENFDLIVINCNFTNNKARENGGALYIKNSFADLVNITFTQNSAPTGGAIYIDIGELNIYNSNFVENNALEGGAIYNKEIAIINIIESYFTNNTGKYGGAIHNEKGSLTITNDEFTNNHADYNGGAIYNTGDIEISNSTFTNNNAQYGGAINHYDQEIIITNTNFTQNNATKYGGAINNEHGEMTITNTNFTQNNAIYGGAIENRYYITLNNCRLENNNAPYGGAIDNDRGEAIIENTQFTNNTASRYGGAIYNDNGKTTITNTNFTQNNGTYGGAINSENGELHITNAIFTENTAEHHGGAVYTIDGDTAIVNANFTNNTAESYGGAIDNGGKTTITNAQFTNNNAQYGGAINNDEILIIGNSVLKNNTATETSGAIENSGTGIILNSQFIENSAGESGGAISNDGKLNIIYSNFTNNTANTAGAIETETNMTISNCEFIGNGENCIDVESDAKITLNNVSSDAQLVDDIISMEILEAKDVIYGNDINIKVLVNSSAISQLNNGKVVVKVNNVEYSVEIKDGIGTLVIPKLDAKTYNANITYIDNNMSRAEIPVNFTVNKKDITINAKNVAYVINYGGTYKVSFTNVSDGTKVTYTLNGKNIGTSVVQKGTASIKLTANILKTAKAGTKNLIIKINSENYSPTSKTVKITINKEKTKITAKAISFKITTKTKKYTIILKNSKNKAINKAKVYLKVKGKTYSAKTNSKGKATFVITKLTKKGTYKAVIQYKGNSYYNKVTKNINIKIK